MKFAKQTLMTGAVLAVLALPARADLITFDPTGTAGSAGDITGVSTFDWSPGNALAVNVNTATGIAGSFTTFYQANLGTVLGTSPPPLFTDGTGGNFFTAVAGFGETVSCATVVGGFCTNATFSFDPTNPTNFFNIFKVPATGGDDLTGANFTGTSILSGVIIPSGFSSNFALSSSSPVPLDQSPDGNQWGSTTTVSGTGASSITVLVTAVNPLYFPTLTVGSTIVLSAFNTSQVLPYLQVNPSRCMANQTTSCAITSNIGTFNGAPIGAGGGPDVLFQADANQSFTVARVPEPGTLALLGLGILVSVVVGKRYKRQ
jgi:hypothetical protein